VEKKKPYLMTLIKIIIRMTQKVLSSMSRCDQEPLPIIPKGKEIKGKERFLFIPQYFIVLSLL